VHLNHIATDIGTINDLRIKERSNTPVLDRLLFKYMLVEFVSLRGPLNELLGVAMKSPRLVKNQPPPFRYVTRRDVDELKALSRAFYRTLAPVQQDLAEIRNDIGAHRKLETVHSGVLLWRKIEPAKYVNAINAFLIILRRLGDLNIYEWSRSFTDGRLATFGATIIHHWEDAFERNEK